MTALIAPPGKLDGDRCAVCGRCLCITCGCGCASGCGRCCCGGCITSAASASGHAECHHACKSEAHASSHHSFHMILLIHEHFVFSVHRNCLYCTARSDLRNVGIRPRKCQKPTFAFHVQNVSSSKFYRMRIYKNGCSVNADLSFQTLTQESISADPGAPAAPRGSSHR